jgi:hypothetical protein
MAIRAAISGFSHVGLPIPQHKGKARQEPVARFIVLPSRKNAIIVYFYEYFNYPLRNVSP